MGANPILTQSLDGTLSQKVVVERGINLLPIAIQENNGQLYDESLTPVDVGLSSESGVYSDGNKYKKWTIFITSDQAMTVVLKISKDGTTFYDYKTDSGTTVTFEDITIPTKYWKVEQTNGGAAIETYVTFFAKAMP